MKSKRQITINLIASGLAFIVNGGISFFLTPYITKTIGAEAYGFISLGSNFINYASLVTISLNSMAGRFITIEIHRKNLEKANKYFNSVFIANIILSTIMLIPSILCVAYLDKIVNVPAEILVDVRILFALLFANFLISVIVSSFGVATFAANKLYLQSLRNIEATIIKAILLVLLFAFLKPAISFWGFVTLIMLIYTTFFNFYYTKKLLPQIKIRKSYFDINAVKELIASGVWNTIIRVGQILLEGVDLLIANLFISSTAMGILSIAKTIPSLISSLVAVIAGVFMPDFTKLYAQKKPEELLILIKRSMNVLGVIVTIPVAILAAYGEEFFKLWVPDENAILLQILSIITIAAIVVSGSINSIYGVFTVTNKLKANAMVVLLTGVLNVTIVFILLCTTNMGIYAIAGVSTVLSTVRNLIFTAPYGAKCLGYRWYVFFEEIINSIICFCIVTLIGLGINYFIEITTWSMFFILSGTTAILGLLFNLMVVIDKSDRDYLLKFVKERI